MPAATLHRVLRQADRGRGPGGGGPLHRAVQAGTHDVPAAREGSEEEARRRARMRTCQSCGRENPPDQDFCQCGEYLRWEPTGFVEAVTPEMAAAAARRGRAARARGSGRAGRCTAARRRPARAAACARSRSPAGPPGTAGPRRRAAARRAAPAPAAEPEPEPATITLRLPDEDAVKGETLAVGVHPGDRARVRALIRNQSGIVDNYQLTVDGLPEEWFSVLPDTVYLVPYGSGGTYEQEVEIHFHPPRARRGRGADLGARRSSRTPRRRSARRRPSRCCSASSRSRSTTPRSSPSARRGGARPTSRSRCATRPTRPSTSPSTRQGGRQRLPLQVHAAGRRDRARRDGRDDGCACAAQADLDRPPARAPDRGADQERRRGRTRSRRPPAESRTSDGATAAACAASSRAGIPGVHGPQIYKPQVYKPNVHLGPGGVQSPEADGPRPADGRARRRAA